MIPSNYPIQACSDEHFLNQFLSWFYQSEPSYFNYSQVVKWFREEYTVTVKQAPTLTLSPQQQPSSRTQPANVLIQLNAVEIATYNSARGQRGALIDSVTFDISLYGTFEVVDNQLTLGQLTSEVTGGNWLGTPILKSILNLYALPELEKRVQAIQLPQFQQLVGTSLTASINDIRIEGNCLRLGADLHDSAGTSAPDALYPGDPKLTVPCGDETTGYLALAAQEQAVNRLIEAILPGMQNQFEEIEGDDFSAIGIKAQVELDHPQVTLDRQNLSGTATIATQLQGGVRLMGNWTWTDIPVATSQVCLLAELAKSPDGTSLLLRFRQLKEIFLTLPPLSPGLESVREPLTRLFNTVLSAFKDDISAAIRGAEIPLFTLPATVPGTEIPAHLAFTDFSLERHRVRAVIRVKQAEGRQ